MTNMIKKVAVAAATGAMALGAAAPMVASAQTSAAVPVGVVFGSNGFGSGACSLPGLFVLGNLFGGQYGNGVVGGTSLGGILMLNQIFCGSNNNIGGGWYW